MKISWPHTAAALLITVVLLVSACGGSATNAETDLSAPDPPVASGDVELPDGTEPVPAAPSEPASPQEAAATEPDADTEAAAQLENAQPATHEFEPVIFDDDFGTSIAPILTTGCAGCHNSGGPGSTDWRLETAGDAVEQSERLASVVSSGYMPPWPASDAGVEFTNHRGLRTDQRQAIIAWASEGGQLDIASDTPLLSPHGAPALSRVDAVLTPPEPYQPAVVRADDYRCFLYDPELTASVGLAGYNLVPDQTEVVHHAVGYVLGRSAMDEAIAVDQASAEAGWPCFGGTDLNANDEFFLAWAPGQEATEFPAGSALMLEAGDFLVIQIHYHYDLAAPLDNTAIELAFVADDASLDHIEIVDFLAPAEIPCRADEAGPLCDRDAALANAIEKYGPEGVLADETLAFCGFKVEDFASMTDGIASSSCELQVDQAGDIISIFGHEHELGATFRMTLNPGRADELLLLDIPDWDFNWQYNYDLAEPIPLEFGDTIGIECSWDRSLRDPSLEPAYIVWADGTDDEMCFASMMIRGS